MFTQKLFMAKSSQIGIISLAEEKTVEEIKFID